MYCEAVRVRVFFGWSPVGPRRGPQKHIYVLNSVTTHAAIFLPVASKAVSAQHCRIPISRRHYSFSGKRSNFDLMRSSSSLNRAILKFVDCHFLQDEREVRTIPQRESYSDICSFFMCVEVYGVVLFIDVCLKRFIVTFNAQSRSSDIFCEVQFLGACVKSAICGCG